MNFADFHTVLLDLDGTLLHGDAAVPGAPELVRHLQDRHIPIAVMSNTSRHSSEVAGRLSRAGMAIPQERILTAVEAACAWTLAHFDRPRVYNLCTDAVPLALGHQAEIVETGPADVVLVADPSTEFCTQPRQQIAFGLLRQGARLVAICEDRAFPSERGLNIGAGAVAHMLAYAAKVQPVFCGKPELRYFTTLAETLSLDLPRCLLIGDNPDTDIVGGKQAGLKTVLLHTPLAHDDGGADLVVNGLEELLK